MTSLPLTPMESYLYHDDLPAHPCWQVMRMVWRGRFQRAPLERAWAEATACQPLWTAVVRRGFLGRLKWELSGGTAPPVHWCARVPGREWPDWLPLDLENGPSVRLYVTEEGETTDVFVCVHHAVCDGLSVLDVVGNAFSRYAIALGETAKLKPDPTFSALRRRGRFGPTLWERCWLPVLQVAGILAESGLMRRTVAPLVPHVPAPPGDPRPDGWPALACRIWSAEETAAIRNAAKREKVTLNELCMRDLQAAIGAWRLAQGVGTPDDWIRLGTPVSLRRKIPGTWPASNAFGITIIDRSAGSLSNRGRLLRRAHEDMTLIEKWKFGYAFWMLLRLRAWWPGGIRAYARRPVVRTTLVLSFLGKPFQRMPFGGDREIPAVPGAVLEDMRAVAPTRPGTCGCMDVAIPFGSLSAYLHYDPRVLTPGKAAALVDEFAAQLKRSVAGE